MKILIQFLLVLAAVIKTTRTEEVIYAQVGGTVTLNIPNTPQTGYYIYWYFGKEENPFAWHTPLGGRNPDLPEIWKNKLDFTPTSMKTTNIQKENFGTITCKLTMSSRVISTTTFRVINVNVDVKPGPLVLPGDSVTLNCNVETPHGQKKPNIYWIDPQGIETNHNREKMNLKAETQHNGQWMCVVDHKYKFTVSVSVADFSPSATQYTSTNSPLKVSVSIKPENYVQQIINNIKKVEWHFIPKTSSSSNQLSLFLLEDQRLDTDDDRDLTFKNFTQAGEMYLSKTQAREEDRGSYTCSITFTNNFLLKTTVQVEVLKITPSPGTELIAGRQLNLSCSTGDHLPPGVQVKWTPPKTASLPKSDLLLERLIIPKVSTKDSGTWRCELQQNNTRLTSAVITLKIEPLLSVWMLVIICGAAVILILLLVVAFILYRRRQRKMRHMRHRLCHCKNPKPKGFYKT